LQTICFFTFLIQTAAYYKSYRAPPPHMSIFSLAKGEKRTRSVRNANVWEGEAE